MTSFFRQELTQIWIRYAIPEPHLRRLEAQFPSIAFILAPDVDRLPAPEAINGAYVWGLTGSELRRLPSLSWVQWIGSGIDTAPIRELADRQILLTSSKGVHATNIAEHVIGLMVALARNFPAILIAQREQRWFENQSVTRFRELAGSRAAILGGGAIGSALATRLAALGVDTTVLRRSDVPEQKSVLANRAQSLGDQVAGRDHLIVCAPLTDLTRGAVDHSAMKQLASGACVYNVGRGPIVVTSDLVSALNEGSLAGAGLDVTDPEPLPSGHPLWSMENVILTAHTAGATARYWDRAIELLATNIGRYGSGEPLLGQADLTAGY